MNKVPLTVIILTYNEEIHLEKCLRSLTKADQVIIVDSHSTDRTPAIAREFGAEFAEHDFTTQAEQFNWALDNLDIRNQWILRLDADEYLLPELWKEIAETLPSVRSEISGFYIKRRVYFMGRWIRHGGYYPTWFLRLFRKDEARSESRPMDEHIFLLQGRAENLENDFVDENKKDLFTWTAKHNDYSTREVRARLEEKQNPIIALEGQAGWKRRAKSFYSQLPLFFRAFAYFFYRYFIRMGFLDGKEGLIFHFLQGLWHQFLIDAKLYEAMRRNRS